MILLYLLLSFNSQTTIPIEEFNSSEYVYCYNNLYNDFFILNGNIDKNQESLDLLRLHNNFLDTISLELDSSRNNSFSIRSFNMKGEYLIISSWLRVYIYVKDSQLNSGLNYKLLDVIYNQFTYDDIYIVGKEVMGIRNFFNFSNVDSNQYTGGFLYNINTTKSNEFILDNPIGTEFTVFQPRKLVTLQNDFFFTISIDSKIISKYDFEGNLLSNFELNLVTMENPIDVNSFDVHQNAKEFIDFNRKNVYNSEWVFNFSTLNDSLLSLSIYDETNPKIMCRTYIINSYNDLKIVDSLSTPYFRGSNVMNLNNPYFISNKFEVHSNRFIEVREMSIPIISGETRDEYNIRFEEYLMENPLYHSFFVYEYFNEKSD